MAAPFRPCAVKLTIPPGLGHLAVHNEHYQLDHADDTHHDEPGYRPADEHVRYPDLRVLSEIVSTIQRLDERLTKLEASKGKKSRPSR